VHLLPSPLGSYCIIDNVNFLVCDQAGCAFLKYETKDQALAALEALNGKHRMEVCFLAVIVKYLKHHSILLYFCSTEYILIVIARCTIPD
jgi:RNA recognition motif. (a.k.a. RRM, RBD, or RNP domain)